MVTGLLFIQKKEKNSMGIKKNVAELCDTLHNMPNKLVISLDH